MHRTSPASSRRYSKSRKRAAPRFLFLKAASAATSSQENAVRSVFATFIHVWTDRAGSQSNKLSFWKQHFPEALIGLGMFLMLLNGVHSIVRDRALAMDSQIVSQFQAPPERPAAPAHIFIRWFVDAGLAPGVYQNGHWTVDVAQATYLEQSARPGENGNIILYGHNKREILGNIRALKGGELITLTTTDGKEHQYKVATMKEVSPTDTDWLEPTDQEVLTLYTCAGLMDAQRFLVRALPVTMNASR